LAYNPDLVLVTVSIDSSFELLPNSKGGFLYARPSYFAVGNDKLVEDRTVQNTWQKSIEAKRFHATRWLRQHSRVWGVISTSASAWNRWCNNFGKPGFTPSITSDQPIFKPTQVVGTTKASRFVSSTKNEEQCTLYSWPIAQGLIKLIKEACQEKNCPLVFIRIPGPDGRENRVETQLLMQSTEKYSVPCLDLTPVFQSELLKQDLKEPLFFQFHFTQAGHRLAEQSMLPFVLRQIQK